MQNYSSPSFSSEPINFIVASLSHFTYLISPRENRLHARANDTRQFSPSPWTQRDTHDLLWWEKANCGGVWKRRKETEKQLWIALNYAIFIACRFECKRRRKWNKSSDDLRLTISSFERVDGARIRIKNTHRESEKRERKFKYDKFPDTIKMNITQLLREREKSESVHEADWTGMKKKNWNWNPRWKLVQKFNELRCFSFI